MSIRTLACIVEGQGEVRAIPVLLRRAALEWAEVGLEVPEPFRLPRTKIDKPSEIKFIERVMSFMQNKAGENGAVLILMDADDDCAVEIAKNLSCIAGRVIGDKLPWAVVVADREYESWFLAAAASLAGHRGFSASLARPNDHASRHGAKEWLGAAMGGSYQETVDQPALSQQFSFEQARENRSFCKFEKEVRRLLGV